ncbi:hypothetical protein Cni_G18282 [Canna indica]|uniref:Uncharacterized protein n=1 Tax=Canna indica TaxID=4628 RepID=A0AAQ3KJ27_9LILI|nr:hypothetical protein Cni_G18282 [Canna indica]
MRGRSFDGGWKRPAGAWMWRELNVPPPKRARIPLPRPPSLYPSEYFVRAVGNPLVEYKRPMFDWEVPDESWAFWDFVPLCISGFNRNEASSLTADISTKDKDPTATFEADKRRLDEALERMQRKVDLEYELCRAFPFLSEMALLHEGQLHTREFSDTSMNSMEEQSEESTSVPMLGYYDHLDEQPSNSLDEQQLLSENSLPKLGPWLEEMQQNRQLMAMPSAVSRNDTYRFNSEPAPDFYLGPSQPCFELIPYPQSANMLSSLLGDMEQPLSSSGSGGRYCMLSCHPQHQELSSVPDVLQHFDHHHQQQQQQSVYSSRNSVIACDKQQYMDLEDSLLTLGSVDNHQHNFKYSNQRLVGSRRQRAHRISKIAPGIRACSARPAHALGHRGIRHNPVSCDLDQYMHCFSNRAGVE